MNRLLWGDKISIRIAVGNRCMVRKDIFEDAIGMVETLDWNRLEPLKGREQGLEVDTL